MNYPITDNAIHDMISVASDDGDDQISFEGVLYFFTVRCQVKWCGREIECTYERTYCA